MYRDVNPQDLASYVDDQLDPWQRVAVEEWLASHPADASSVMADLRLRNELRLAFPPSARPDDARLARRYLRAMRQHRIRRIGSIVSLVASIVLAAGIAVGPLGLHESLAASPPPPFVQGALSARDASVLRLAMMSAPEALHVDPQELLAMTGIVIPNVPSTWIVRDVQIFPSPAGPGVEMVFDTPLHGRLSMFSVRSLEETDVWGTYQRGDLALAWFRRADVIYTLSGLVPKAALEATTRDMATF